MNIFIAENFHNNKLLFDTEIWIIKTIPSIILIAIPAKHVAGNAVGVVKVISGSVWMSWRKWWTQRKWICPYFLSNMCGRFMVGFHFKNAL